MKTIIPIEEITEIYFQAYREALNKNLLSTEASYYAMRKVNKFVEEFNKLEKIINEH